ncbi:unnamed protein product [Clonostachys solani]|uniref:Uncharacterized protein n=1 Tax=Clonostachys solani TaxID=160281 RepID=A0A9P0EMF3_9HYPO|nr:unnamed protein product [Clonostachys solani]
MSVQHSTTHPAGPSGLRCSDEGSSLGYLQLGVALLVWACLVYLEDRLGPMGTLSVASPSPPQTGESPAAKAWRWGWSRSVAIGSFMPARTGSTFVGLE